MQYHGSSDAHGYCKMQEDYCRMPYQSSHDDADDDENFVCGIESVKLALLCISG